MNLIARPRRDLAWASRAGAGLGVAMRGLSAYDSLKSEAMGHMNQAAQVATAAKRGLQNY